MKKGLIVYDSDHPGARNNICFSPEFRDKGSGHSFTVELADQVKSAGYDIVTADVFLAAPRPSSPALLITDMVSADTEKVIAHGAIPFLNYSIESPIIARTFYLNIKSLAGRFKHNIQFRGTFAKLKNTPTQFETMYFPVDGRKPLPRVAWSEKKFLVLVNSNKRAFFHDRSDLKKRIRSVLSQLRLEYQKMIDPWMRSKEIYKDRVEIIHYFSKRSDFSLYGVGWENPIPGFSNEYSDSAKKANKGRLNYEDKYRTMSTFKFAICFENCDFDGYVTEKIFDCFLAGTIPVYYGPSTIGDFVPADTFIDYRQFATLKDLEQHLLNISEAEGKRMLDAAAAFLNGPEFEKYYLRTFISNVVKKIENYLPKS